MLQRVLALDVGEKRIGVAVGGSDVKIAVPNGIIKNDSNVIDSLKNIIDKKSIDIIVIGLPRNSSGQETKQTKYVRDFSKGLKVFALPIVFQDESLTSVEAENIIQQKNKVVSRTDRENGLVDSGAAAIILTDYLEANYGHK